MNSLTLTIQVMRRSRAGGSGVSVRGSDPVGATGTGKIPHVSDAGRGIQATGQIPHVGNADPSFWTTGGAAAYAWLSKLAARLERVRVIHGNWSRCLNNHYGKESTAVFLDPPYLDFEGLYGTESKSIADEVVTWCRENGGLRVALCGHVGDYELPGWDAVQWERSGNTYSGSGTKDQEMIWFSPACLPRQGQMGLWGAA